MDEVVIYRHFFLPGKQLFLTYVLTAEETKNIFGKLNMVGSGEIPLLFHLLACLLVC